MTDARRAAALAVYAWRTGDVPPLTGVALDDDPIFSEAVRRAGAMSADVPARVEPAVQALLTAAELAPDTPVSSLDLLPAADRAVLEAAHRPSLPPPDDMLAHQRVAAVAAAHPERIAVCDPRRALSYGDLVARAAGVADALRSRGVRRGDLVGLVVERGADAVAAMLGVLSAGAAYLPLDPAYPPARLEQMTDDAQVAAVLTASELADIPTGDPAGAWQEPVDPDDLAYCLYTSGSTGKPKGVLVEHGNLMAEWWAWERLHAFAADPPRWLSVSSVSFDVFTGEWLHSLTAGGTLILATRDAVYSGEVLAEQIAAERIDTVNVGPAAAAGLIRALRRRPERLPTLRRLFVGGDRFPAGDYEELRRQLPQVTVVNAYGVTEATIDSAQHSGDADVPLDQPVPVGRPLPGTRLAVLDRFRRPVPVGVQGELYVFGPQVARGYLRRPELTAERFVEVDGDRAYCTGDRARWRPDGTLQVLGRLDDQVKVRGFRIEAGEVERRLIEHPGVAAAAVTVRDGRLLGYVVPENGPVAVDELRDFAAQTLPEHAVPSLIASVDELPLTPNGKVDRRALPDPGPARPALSTTYAAPSTPGEEAVASVWREVLGVERIGVHDRFFDLGGHSLLAVAVAGRVADRLDRAVPAAQLFDTPTVAAMAAAVAALPARPGPAAARTDGADAAPVPPTAAQRALWFLDRLHPGSDAYHVPLVLRLRGRLDRDALRCALQLLVDRHDALRTTLIEVDGEPRRHVAAEFHVPLPDERIADLAAARERVAALVREPFDLASRVMRASLLQLDDDDALLVLVIHHVACDGRATQILEDELAKAYRALVEDRAPFLPAPPISYSDIARAERDAGAAGAWGADVAWWRSTLAGVPAVQELPLDRPRLPRRDPAGSSVAAEVPVVAAVARLAAGSSATPFIVLLAALAATLRSGGRSEDVVIGSPLSGRWRPDVEDVVGLFVNSAPLRVDCSGDPSFAELVDRARAAVVGAFAHGTVPFDRLVDELGVPRTAAYDPLVQVALVLNQRPPGQVSLPGLDVEVWPVEPRDVPFDLAWEVHEQGDHYRVRVSFATSLLDRGTVDALLHRFARVLSVGVADPTAPLSGLPFLDADEATRISGWEDGGPPAGTDPVPDRVSAMAERHGARTAIEADGQVTTYRQLVEAAGQVRAHLQAVGVVPGQLVAVDAPRGPALAAGVLGGWLAGAGALVLRGDAPPSWRAAVHKQTQPAAVVDGALQVRPAEQPGPVTPDLAYVVSTSGSTGQPKGVEVGHAALANLVAWHVDAYDIGPGDRCGWLAGLGFDAAVWELWGALAVGATAVAAPDDVRVDSEQLARWIVDERLDVVFAPTPLAEELLALEPQVWAGGRLRVLLTGGDRLTRAPRTDLPFRVVNHYGPSETCVVATAGEVAPTDAPPLIGRPLPGLRVRIVGPGGRRLPLGGTGELWVAGVGVALGYRSDPALTAERFVQNDGERWYRTGDLGRWRAGSVEFVGRDDGQVKVRGVRLELGEVEAALASLPGVRTAAAAVREGRLAAWVTGGVDGAAVRRVLAERLPRAAVPDAVCVVDRLPLNDNGKVDVAALPAPAWMDGSVGEAPESDLEARMTAIWADVLNVPNVGVTDDFFDLGGHSLLATRILARVRRDLGLHLPLHAIFDATTPRRLLESAGSHGSPTERAVRPVERRGDAPLTRAQRGLWYLNRLDPNSSAYLVPVCWRLRGRLDLEALRDAWTAVVARHEVLRTTFPEVSGVPVQRVGSAAPLQVIDVPDGSSATDLARVDAQRPFGLAVGPPVRATLFRAGPDDAVLSLVFHHIVCDAWSLEVLCRDLSASYDGLDLAPPPVQPYDVAVADQAADTAGDLSWWRQQLAGVHRTLGITGDRPRPPVPTGRAVTVPLRVDPAVTALAAQVGGTPLHAAVAVTALVLGRWGLGDDVVLGVPIARRERPELAETVGFFVHSLPIRVDLAGEPSFTQLLGRVRAATLGAVGHAGVALDSLVDAAAGGRSARANPLFQAMVTVTDQAPQISLTGLHIEPVETAPVSTSFDVTVTLGQDGTGELTLSADAFTPAAAQRMATALERAASFAAQCPEQPLAAADLLSSAEQARVLGFAAGPVVPVPDESVACSVVAAAQAAPAAPAIEGLSYAQLLDESRRVAGHLVALGVRRGEPVAVCLPRGADLAVALLAVWLAGAAYVPVDPDYPLARRRLLEQRSGAVTTVDRLPAGPAPVPAADLPPMPGPDDVAYVVFTSGSTGTPKGVTVRHRSLRNLVAWHNTTYRLGPGDRVPLLAGVGFDASAWELWPTLSAGASLHVPPTDVRADPRLLAQWFADTSCTVAFAPTPLAEELLAVDAWPEGLRLRTLLTGGGALTVRPPPGLPFDVVNHYGPTEGTVVATAGPVASTGDGRPDIGRPVGNTRCYVLDPHRQLVPLGVPGELHLAGALLADGYLDEPEATADSFLDLEVAGRVERAYRTGDRVRWRPDGTLEFLGRVDEQIEVRGTRVEPGEVEALLAASPGAGAVAATVRDGRLVGYVTGPADPHQVREAIRAVAPGHLVPAVVVRMERLPVTANGKLDRAALPDPPSPSGAGRAPTNEVEQALAEVWRAVLRVDEVGVDDGFFALGGDSILSIQLVARAADAGVLVTPRQVLEQQTIAELAAVATLRPSGDVAAEPVPEGPFPPTPIQRWLFELDLAAVSHFNQSALVDCGEELDPDALSMALGDVADRHDALRTRRIGAGLSVVADAHPVVEVAAGSWSAAAQATQAGLDVERGPTVRAVVKGPQLLLVVHHLCVDWVSWPILLDDLERAYEARRQGRPPRFPPRTTSYARWAHLLQERGGHSIPWRDDGLPLGTWAEDDVLTTRLDVDVSAALLRDVGSAYRATAHEVLLAALGRAIGGGAVAVERHGRDQVDDVDLSRTVGWFTTIQSVLLPSHEEPGRQLLATRHAVREPEAPAPRATVSFNYLGHRDTAGAGSGRWRVVDGEQGESIGPTNRRAYGLDVVAGVRDGRLNVEWHRSPAALPREWVVQAAEAFAREVGHLVNACQTGGGALPADFPLSGLDEAGLLALAPDPAAIDDLVPLTAAQQGMLFHTLIDPDAYLEQHVWFLPDDVDAEALTTAWRRVAVRHPVLRARVAWQDVPHPLLVVERHAVLPVTRLEADRLDEALAADQARGLDLERAPLARVLVVQAEGRSAMVWTHHHLLLDGWSVGLLLDELGQEYDALVSCRPSPHPPARRPFRDFVAWQRAQRTRDDEHRVWWQAHLAGITSPTPLGVDGTGTTEGTLASVSWSADDDTWVKLTEAMACGQFTFATAAQAAWALVLARASGDQDIVFGAAASGRPAELVGVEHMVGLFLNLLAIRIHVDPHATVAGLVAAVQQQANALRDHEHTPLVDVRRWSDVAESAPLFESVLVVETLRPIETGRLALAPGPVLERSGYPLTVRVSPGPQMTVTVTYDGRRIGASAAAGLARSFHLALRAVGEGAAEVVDVDLTHPHDAALVAGWGDGGPALPADAPVGVRITQALARQPDIEVLVAGHDRLTARDLLDEAARVAGGLRHAGVAPGDLVAIALPRDSHLVPALLGTWLAGAAYLPFDPAWPVARIAAVVDVARPRLALVTTATARNLPAQLRRLDLPEALAAAPLSPEGHPGGPDDLAYVLFTSGSTGQPKGVEVTHRSLAAFLAAMVDHEPGLAAGERALAVTTIAFDIAALELFGPLLTGGTVVLADEDAARDPQRLVELALAEQVTFVQATPTTWWTLLDVDWLALRPRAVCGGETLTAKLADALRPRVDELWNAYGPTETTVWSTVHCLDAVGRDRVPVGRPIPGTQAEVRDAVGRLLPPGVPGELYLGGAGVARGYRGRPDLTADRFSVDADGQRWYRTGDRARWLDADLLEHLGRDDEQVKVRGFRVELGDVEAALLHAPGVGRSVAAVRGAGAHATLAGYVVPLDPDQPPSPDAVRTAAAERLPSYLVPDTVTVLDALPLTANGKLDRGALPDPAPAAATASRVAPRTSLEELLVEVWQEVLGASDVGVTDSFFNLGGHSLLAVAVTSRLRAALGRAVTVRTVFDHPTIAQLATALTDADEAHAEQPLVPVPRDGPLPLTAGQRRLWFLHQLAPQSSAYVLSLTVRLRGRIDLDALSDAVAALVARHEPLRTTFHEADGEPVQIVHESGDTADTQPLLKIEEVASAEEALDLAGRIAVAPFTLSNGTFRAVLLRVGTDEGVLVLALHHLCGDGWSLDVLTRDLASLYAGERLPALPVQAADVAARESAPAAVAYTERNLNWWQAQLPERITPVELPADRPRLRDVSRAGATISRRLPAETGRVVAALAVRLASTPFTVLLAGFAAWLSRVTGAHDLVVGVPFALRTQPEVADIVGFLVETLPLHLDLADDPSVAALIGQARDTSLDAAAHSNVPVERLAHRWRAPGSGPTDPLFDVAFALQNHGPRAPLLGGAGAELVTPGERDAPFDLTVEFEQCDGDELRFTLSYAAGRFARLTAEGLADSLAALITDLAAGEPDRPVSSLDVLSREQRQQVHGDARCAPVADERGLADLFDEVAAARPTAIAVSEPGGRALTYAELAAASRAIAAWLRGQGVTRGDRVGVELPRGIDLVVALLAVLRAGAAYVPLDADYPPARRAYMVQDAGVRLVLTAAELSTARRTEPVGHDPATIGDDPAYVVYTSGSTGSPKGIEVPQRAVVGLVRDTNYIQLGADDVVAQASNASFDAATFEIWGALLSGARLHVVPTHTLLDPAALSEQLRTAQVTTLFVTTALFNAVAADRPDAFRSLRHLLFGGEAVDAGAVRRVLAAGRPERLLHVYGPTETTTFATWHEVTEVPDGGTVPIGRPLAHTVVLVLDERLRPVPPGTTGEICIGGPRLATGYLGRPDLTAEQFVESPWGRLYRTGDLGRRGAGPGRPIEFLGRVDAQVKLRGFRIEPGEVEAALREIGARDVVVTVVDHHEDKELIAYVVPGAEGQRDSEHLRATLRRSLPEWMVPSAVVWLDALPLTENGKVNRRALPKPMPHDRLSASFTPPRTETERRIALLWADLLGVDQVGVHEGFFELGGHSLLATRLLARVHATFGVEIPLRALFDAPTVADLATRVTAAVATGAAAPPPRITRVPREVRRP